jgi:hypothetical protein
MYGGETDNSIFYWVAPGTWNNAVENFTDIGKPFGIRGYIVEYDLSSVPIPPAIWLFGSGLLGLIGITRHKR